MNSLAPIVLFVYNRPWHTEQTLNALMQNELADQSVLYIYADGPKQNANEEQLKKIEEVRQVIRKKKWCKEVHIIQSEKNKGLADSVIDGTTAVVNKYGKVITLEDDVIAGRFFLRYMNRALTLYFFEENVFMISGYNFPVKQFSKKNECFFLPVGTSQAWGTWQKEWNVFDTKATGYEKIKEDNVLRSKFNLDDSYDFATMLELQMESDKISSWAIRYRWTLFQKNGLTLFPDRSLIKNIGWDGSGTHSGPTDPYEDLNWQNDYSIIYFPKEVKWSHKKLGYHKSYLKGLSHISSKNTKLVRIATAKKLYYQIRKLIG